jgi:hypothetical protein
MTYLQRLHPWCIIAPAPDMRTIIVGRFRRRVDGRGTSANPQATMPSIPFEIAFDVKPDNPDD